MTTTTVRFQQRHNLASFWDTSSDVLLSGELGVAYDTTAIKVGDGSNNWSLSAPLYLAVETLNEYLDVTISPLVLQDGAVFTYYLGAWRESEVPIVDVDPVDPTIVYYKISGFDDVVDDFLSISTGHILLWNTVSNNFTYGEVVLKAITNATPPSTSTSSGQPGDVRYSGTHIYICVANNTWKRVPLTTW